MEVTAHSEELNFQKYWLVLKRRWLPATATLAFFLALGFVASLRQKVLYRSDSQLLIETDKSSKLTGINNNTGDIDTIAAKSDPLSTEAEIIRSRPIIEQAIEKLDLKNDEGEFVKPGYLLSSLKVEPVVGTDILKVSYEGEDRELVAKVVNAVIDTYIENDVLTNRSQAIAARKFIEDQIPQVEQAVTRAEAELRQFKEANRVADLEAEGQEIIKTLGILENQIARSEAQLADSQAQFIAVRQRVGMGIEEALALSSLSQSAGVQQALNSLQEVQVQLASDRSRLMDNNPQIINLREREAALNTLLQERINQTVGSRGAVPSLRNLQVGALEQGLMNEFVNLEVQRSGLTNQLAALTKTYNERRKRLNVIPRLEQRLRELTRKLEAAQSTYQTLLEKLQETQVAENQNIGNARIISQALEPEKALASQSNLIILAGGVVGILSGVAIAFLLDAIDKSVKTVTEAKELFQHTVLGIIPHFDRSGKTRILNASPELNIPRVIARDMSQSSVREAYQMLQANLKYLNSDKSMKSIVVASSVSGEGKSEVSANLAATMAHVGRRVLLIDADMRQPMQHHVWGLTNAVGLSNVLIGEVEWDEATEEVMPGLDVITSGVIPPNPVALLDSQRMARLIESFSRDYDYVIFDTPPLIGIADTTILGKMVDGLLLVVRPQVVDSASAKSARELLERTGQHVLGVVANGVMIKSDPDGYFYYREEQYRSQKQTSLERV